MPKKPSMKEVAREFRFSLATNLDEAQSLLREYPALIDYPVYGDSESALHFFATENRPDLIVWLVDHGANPDGISSERIPLHDASVLGHLEVCRVLLCAGANPNLQDSFEETPLHKASQTGRIPLIDLLLSSGADPSIADMCGELPIYQALPRKANQVRAIFEKHNASM